MKARPFVLLLSLHLPCVLSLRAAADQIPSGTWRVGASLSAPRTAATATLMNDGRLLIVGGKDESGNVRVGESTGHSIGTSGVVTSFNLVQIIGGTIATTVEEAVSSTTPDTNFRWDPAAQQWIFNVSTKPLSTQKTYVYSIGLNDGSTILFQYGLPK